MKLSVRLRKWKHVWRSSIGAARESPLSAGRADWVDDSGENCYHNISASRGEMRYSLVW